MYKILDCQFRGFVNAHVGVFEIPEIPFVFELELESERPNGNLATVLSALDKVSQTAEWYSAIPPIFLKWLNGNSVTVLSPNCHSAIQTQTQTEPEAYRMHHMLMHKLSCNRVV